MSVYDDARRVAETGVGPAGMMSYQSMARALIDLMAMAEGRTHCAVFLHRRCEHCPGCRLDALLRRIKGETT